MDSNKPLNLTTLQKQQIIELERPRFDRVPLGLFQVIYPLNLQRVPYILHVTEITREANSISEGAALWIERIEIYLSEEILPKD